MPGLPPALAGLRILHLADFHLGPPSPGSRAFERAITWAAAREPDLVAITGDLVSAPRGVSRLERGLARLSARNVVAVLGNHDIGVARDPVSRPASLDLGELGVCLLEDAAVDVPVRGGRVQVVGISPVSYLAHSADPDSLADPTAGLRLLLCHFPRVVDRWDCSAFQLVLAGHMHGGQICVPLPGRKLRLAHLGAKYPEGRFRVNGTTLVVSKGLGTTLVPLRFFARPEAVELVLEPA